MSIVVELKAFKVILDGDVDFLIKAYRDAFKGSLGEASITFSKEQQAAPSLAALSDEDDRKGFWARQVLSTLEVISDEALGAKEVKFGALSLKLEVPAELLLSAYIEFLNKLLFEQKISTKDAESEIITSKYLVIRALLYRLAAIALSNNFEKKNDGDSLLKVLDTFIKKITSSKILVDGPVMGFLGKPKNSAFLNLFTNEHPRWQQQIKQMVGMVKLIHKNTTAISSTLSYLKTVEYTVQARLIAFLDVGQGADGFSTEFLSTSLKRIESRLLLEGSTNSSASSSTQLILKDNMQITVSQRELLAVLSPKKYTVTKQAKIISLYELLNRTRELYEMMAQIDLLFTYAGWMPILGNCINFKKLSAYLNSFGVECNKTLIIEEEFKDIFKSSVAVGLVSNGFLNNSMLHDAMLESVEDLNSLQDPFLKERIGRMVGYTVTYLLQYQSKLDPSFQFIETTRIPSTPLLQIGSGSETKRLENDETESLKAKIALLEKERDRYKALLEDVQPISFDALDAQIKQVFNSDDELSKKNADLLLDKIDLILKTLMDPSSDVKRRKMLFNAARMHHLLSEYEAALAKYNEALKDIDPNNKNYDSVRFMRACLHYDHQQYVLAQKEFSFLNSRPDKSHLDEAQLTDYLRICNQKLTSATGSMIIDGSGSGVNKNAGNAASTTTAANLASLASDSKYVKSHK